MSKTKNSAVAKYIELLIAVSDKSQSDLATEAGFSNQSTLSMIKSGTVKMPLNRATALAAALGVDPAEMVRRIMREYQPEIWAMFERVFGDQLNITPTDRKFIAGCRKLIGKGELPDLEDEEVRASLEGPLREASRATSKKAEDVVATYKKLPRNAKPSAPPRV